MSPGFKPHPQELGKYISSKQTTNGKEDIKNPREKVFILTPPLETKAVRLPLLQCPFHLGSSPVQKAEPTSN